MAKDKTKPRADLAPRREIAAKIEAEAKAAHRRRLALIWLVTIVIVALIVVGILSVFLHVKGQEREASITGPATAQQTTPPNAVSEGRAIAVKPDAAAAFAATLPTPTPTSSDSGTPTDTPSDTPTATTTPSGPVTVDFYVDFQDGMSSSIQQTYGLALATLAGKGEITLQYHFLTSGDSTNANTASSRAAIAAACADTVGKFLPYTQAALTATPLSSTSGQLVFSDQQLQTTFPAAAGITGTDLTNFRACYTQRAMSSFIATMNTANQTTAVPGNSTYTSGVTSAAVMLANSQTVDIADDLYGETPSDDEASLLALLQYSAAGTSS